MNAEQELSKILSEQLANIDPIKLHGSLFSEAPEKIPNSEKIKELLGWKPTKNVEQILEEVVEFYKKNLL